MPRGTNSRSIKKTVGNSPGRPQGSKNRVAHRVKEAIMESFEELGKDYLMVLATEYPSAYVSLLCKILPNAVHHEHGRAGEFDELSDEELDGAIRERLARLGFASGAEGTETIIQESDPVHTSNIAQIPARTPPSPDS